MALIFKVKRRISGATGAPSSLQSGEIAYNNVDGILYIGFGDDGGGNATSIKAFAKDNFSASTTYQVQDADLDAIAALSTTGLSVRTGAGTWTLRSITGTAGRITVTNGDGVAGAPTIDLATVSVGSTVSGGSTKFTVDGYGRVTNAGQASLSDMSAPTGDVPFGGFKITGIGAPSTGTDAANKQYVDGAIAGINAKSSVRLASTGQQALSGGTAFPTIDGVAVAAGDRVLLKEQTAPAENGIYVVGGTGAAWTFTRATDADSFAELIAAYTFVELGSTNADKGFLSTADQGGTLGSTAIVFTQFSAAGTIVGGNGLTATGNTLDVNTDTSLGTTITSDKVVLTGQALALHQVTTAANQLIYATGAGAFAVTSFTAFGRSLVDDADASTARATLGVVIGTDVQAQNARLANLAGATITTADNIILYGASNAATVLQLGATGKALLDDGTQADARTTLGLGTMATQSAGAVAITGGTIDGVTLDGGTF